jgi:hypothetical protein
MKTSIDLKLNLKNFTGTLPNGKKYRIRISNDFIESSKTYQLHVFVEDLFEYTYSDNVWMAHSDFFVFEWYKKGCYKVALRDALIKLEDKLNVELLKSTMSIAV